MRSNSAVVVYGSPSGRNLALPRLSAFRHHDLHDEESCDCDCFHRAPGNTSASTAAAAAAMRAIHSACLIIEHHRAAARVH